MVHGAENNMERIFGPRLYDKCFIFVPHQCSKQPTKFNIIIPHFADKELSFRKIACSEPQRFFQ